MPRTFPALLLTIFLAAGCETKKAAQIQAQQAYLAGQQQASKQWEVQRPPEVVLRGPVRNNTVPWEDGLTLAKAIVDAEYTAFMNPLAIRVIRDGAIVADMKGVDLLHHQDFPLEPGDIVDIVP